MENGKLFNSAKYYYYIYMLIYHKRGTEPGMPNINNKIRPLSLIVAKKDLFYYLLTLLFFQILEINLDHIIQRHFIYLLAMDLLKYDIFSIQEKSHKTLRLEKKLELPSTKLCNNKMPQIFKLALKLLRPSWLAT